MSVITEETKAEIDRMSREELVLENSKGARSRFQRDNFAHLQARLNTVDQLALDKAAKAQTSVAEEANAIAREANDISREANLTSSNAYRLAGLAAVISLVAIVVALIPQCQNGL